MQKNKKIDDKDFIIRLVETVREQMLEYILWKLTQYKTYEEFREGIKKELCHLHEKNMKKIDRDINGK